jgi:spermidine synthase
LDGPLSRAGRAYLVLTAFLSGASVMVLEMAAVRAVAPYFGQSNYIWTYVIGIILAALSVGYFLGGRLIDRVPRPAVLFGILLGGGVLALLLPLVVQPVCRWLMPAELAVEGAADLFNKASLAATLILFAPPVLLLAMISPMAIRLVAVPGQIGDASGRIYAASTVGSIVGTFATTFVLIEAFGTRMTIGIAGAVLALTAVLGLLMLGRTKVNATVSGAAVVAVVFLLFGAANAGPLKTHPGQVEEVESAYQYVRVIDDEVNGEIVRLLQFNEAEQTYQSVAVSGKVLTGGRYFDYYSVLPYLFPEEQRKNLRVLVIGLAAGTIPRQLKEFFPDGLSVTGVEIDPAVVRIGREHFGMPDDAPWLRTVVADGRVWLNGAPKGEEYDLVIVDAFAKEYYIPFHLATREAFEAGRRRLRKGGILAMNIAAFRQDSRLLTSIESTVAHAFGKAWRSRVDGYANYMVFAMRDEQPQFKRLFSLPRGRTAEGDQLRRIARIVKMGATEVNPTEGLCLTDDKAPLERYMDLEIRGESRRVLGK